MKENEKIFEQAGRWSVLGEYRPILRDFAGLSTADFSLEKNQHALEVLFADYLAKLRSEASRSDKQSLLYLRLAPLCSPEIFQDKKYGIKENLNFLDSPIQKIDDPLYVIAREVQRMAPGSLKLLSVPEYFFKPEEKFPNLIPTILEYTFRTRSLPNPVAMRIPALLRYDPTAPHFIQSNLPLVQRIAEVLKSVEENVSVDIKHLPRYAGKDNELIVMHAEAPVLDWPALFPGARITTPIVAAFSETPQLPMDDSQFESITISSGEVTKSWQGSTRGTLFKRIIPIPEAVEWWSFQNTVNQITNVVTERSVRNSAELATDILSLEGIRVEREERSATFAVHAPILIMAAYAQTVVQGVRQGLALRESNQIANDKVIREQRERSWA
ncbi:MAG: hypothetical protein HYV90_04230 [Candidatus Woesebacteria bacterium]|nr:MAG: hypothetical protein HYV90_04230 [Candidatus Woesebacteria bacterium]